jgi:hypothetical protein
MVEDPAAQKPQWGGRRPGAGRPRRSDPRYCLSKYKRARNSRCEDPIADPIVEGEATPEHVIAEIKYLIAEMRFFKSADPHKLEYRLATLFNHRGDIPKPARTAPGAHVASRKAAAPP